MESLNLRSLFLLVIWSHGVETFNEANGSYENCEETLIKELFDVRAYDKRSRPILGHSDDWHAETRTIVEVEVKLHRVLEMDEQNEMMTIAVYIYESWIDNRLYWQPNLYGNLTRITVNTDLIWIPDLMSSAVTLLNDDDRTGNTHAAIFVDVVSRRANVTLFYPAILQHLCNMDLTYFPFDIQNCPLSLTTKSSDQTQIVLQPNAYQNDTCQLNFGDMNGGGEWDLLSCQIKVGKYRLGRSVHSGFDLRLGLRRRCSYYVLNVIVPTALIALINIVGLFLRIRDEETQMDAISIGLTTLLALSVVLLTVADRTPKGSHNVSLISTYFITVMAHTVFATIVSVILRDTKYRNKLERLLIICPCKRSTVKTVTNSAKQFSDNRSEFDWTTLCTLMHVIAIVVFTITMVLAGMAHNLNGHLI